MIRTFHAILSKFPVPAECTLQARLTPGSAAGLPFCDRPACSAVASSVPVGSVQDSFVGGLLSEIKLHIKSSSDVPRLMASSEVLCALLCYSSVRNLVWRSLSVLLAHRFPKVAHTHCARLPLAIPVRPRSGTCKLTGDGVHADPAARRRGYIQAGGSQRPFAHVPQLCFCHTGLGACCAVRESPDRSSDGRLLRVQVIIGDIIDPVKSDAVTSILMGTAWHLDLEQIRPMRNQSAPSANSGT
jgi:hypothetical protein